MTRTQLLWHRIKLIVSAILTVVLILAAVCAGILCLLSWAGDNYSHATFYLVAVFYMQWLLRNHTESGE